MLLQILEILSGDPLQKTLHSLLVSDSKVTTLIRARTLSYSNILRLESI